jgi:hypothetical protein
MVGIWIPYWNRIRLINLFSVPGIMQMKRLADGISILERIRSHLDGCDDPGDLMTTGNWQFFWLPSEPERRFWNYGTLRGISTNADWWRFGRLEIRRLRR